MGKNCEHLTMVETKKGLVVAKKLDVRAFG